MNNETPESTEATEAKTDKQLQLEQHEVPELMAFLKENGIAIVIGVLVAVVAFVGYSAWKNSRQAKIDTASTLLATSQSIQQFQEIVANYAGTPAAPMAQLSLAAAHYDQGAFESARAAFAQFKADYPGHGMSAVADLGVAQSLEALGQFDEALAAYDAFLSAHPDHYQASAATFGRARVFEAQQKFAEAEKVYEDFIAANPDSRWTGRAEAGLDFVQKQARASSTP